LASPIRSMRTAAPRARRISSIAERGTAKIWPPALTVSAGMMVRVSGTRMTRRTPCPQRESMSTTPPIRSILARTTSMPTPRPEMAVTWPAVESPGEKMSAHLSPWESRSARSGAIMPAAIALRTSASASMPRPSSITSIRIWLPAWRAHTRSIPAGSLPDAARSAAVSIP
jgi:hypothetical protein